MYLHIPLLFNETNTMASIIYLFSDSLNHCHRRSRYVVLFVCFLYIVTKPMFTSVGCYFVHFIFDRNNKRRL
jgi:hypothetical protein